VLSSKLSVPVAAIVAALFLVASAYPSIASAQRLFDFEKAEALWTVANDGVMGGVSTSRLVTKGGIAKFSGAVSLENNGGFASVRSGVPQAAIPNDATAFQVRVKGDGKAFQFNVDTPAGWYWYSMTPAKGKWSMVTIPFADLVPVTRFGEPTQRAQFNSSQPVTRIGVLISNKRAENFSLSLDWIGVSS
jgi:NADH dehydrogenase [ubiquinone] 1 alpha subcomplex assembly factor 1